VGTDGGVGARKSLPKRRECAKDPLYTTVTLSLLLEETLERCLDLLIEPGETKASSMTRSSAGSALTFSNKILFSWH
jgi:hypothetical protein